MKKILSGNLARREMLAGMQILSESVAATLGPQGRNAVIHIGWGQIPNSTRDGVTVAKAIDLADPVQNAGAQLLKNVAAKTAEVAGDGTTTATVLACYMCRAGIEAIEQGANPVQLKREILAATDEVIAHLRKMARPVTPDKVEQVATISANNDAELGRLIADAVRQAGTHGVITVEDSNNLTTALESAEGMRLSSGWASPYFVNDPQKQEFRADDCRVMIFERKLGNLTRGLQETLAKIAASREPLLILAESIEGDMLATLVANRMGNQQKGIPPSPWCAVRIPQGSSRDFLHDVAAVVEGSAITQDRGISDDEAPMQFMGTAKSVRVTKTQTTLVGYSRSAEVESRIESIKTQLAQTQDMLERDRFQERLAKLSGGVSVLRVGAATEVELREKKARIEDAIHATKAAIEEGVLPGGGTALGYMTMLPSGEGGKIVFQAMREPMRRIIANSGESLMEIFGLMDAHQDKPNFGFNALTGKFEDLMEAGVIDPAKVTITALRNAASIASIVLLTETLIVDVEEPATLVQAR